MKKTPPSYIIYSQVTSRVLFDLANAVASNLGPTILLTGNTYYPKYSELLDVRLGPQYENRSLVSRFKTWLLFMVFIAKESRNIGGRPVTIMTTNPPVLPWFGLYLRWKNGWPCVVRILDVYPDVIISKGITSEKSLVVSFWKFMNRKVYESIDVLITLAPLMAEKIASQMVKSREIIIIPEMVDTDRIRPIPKSDNSFALKLDQINRITFLYSGNLGITHDISGLYGAIAELMYRQDIVFLFVGGGSRQSELEKFCSSHKNAQYVPFQSESILPLLMASGDIGIVTLDRDAGGLSMPSKAYHMMSAGCALLGLSDANSDISGLISLHSCGICVESNSVSGIKAAILKMSDDTGFLMQCRTNSRHATLVHYSSRVCIKEYLDILSRL